MERDAFPKELRQETNSAVMILLMQFGSLPPSFHWHALLVRATLEPPNGAMSEVQELFGCQSESVLARFREVNK